MRRPARHEVPVWRRRTCHRHRRARAHDRPPDHLGDGAFVWAVRDGKAQRVPIQIRQRNTQAVLVEGDLAEGDPVVIEGVQTLRPGAEIAAQPDAAALDAALPARKT